MNELSGFIVVFWLFPVTLFIVTPLCMLASWTIFKFIAHLANKSRVTITPSAGIEQLSSNH